MVAMRGGSNRLSDEEKKAKGTFRADRSDAVYAERAAGKVITGVFLSKIPEPNLPLNEVGRAMYDKMAKLLFEQNKLTEVTCLDCENLGLIQQQMDARMRAGKAVASDMIKRKDAILVRLRVAENAPAVASPGEKNRFEGSGFSNSRIKAFRLRSHT
jgi:hypothetical protein